MQTKVNKTTFDHPDNFSGDIEISRDGITMRVPMDDLVRMVAEKVRHDRIRALERAKPSELIAKLA